MRIQRFSATERILHWSSALSFLYATLSGLSLWTHQLYWLSAIFGGGTAVRRWHPWAGALFAALLGIMFWQWAKVMRLDADDRRWLRKAHRYAVNDETGLPEAGRFNAGQKMLFWMQSLATVVLLLSGIVLWLPAEFPRTATLTAVLVHPLAALFSIAGIIVHIYMGTLAVPGALRSMVHGWVSSTWARAHHPKWYRETLKR